MSYIPQSAWSSALAAQSNFAWITAWVDTVKAMFAAAGLWNQHASFDYDPSRNYVDTLQLATKDLVGNLLQSNPVTLSRSLTVFNSGDSSLATTYTGTGTPPLGPVLEGPKFRIRAGNGAGFVITIRYRASQINDAAHAPTFVMNTYTPAGVWQGNFIGAPMLAPAADTWYTAMGSNANGSVSAGFGTVSVWPNTVGWLGTYFIDEINVQTIEDFGCPVGSIIAFHKSGVGVTAIGSNWVQCIGGTINDTRSPMNGQPIPDLATNPTFLGGYNLSATALVAANMPIHAHKANGAQGGITGTITVQPTIPGSATAGAGANVTQSATNTNSNVTTNLYTPAGSTSGPDRATDGLTTNNWPLHMKVAFIMRIW